MLTYNVITPRFQEQKESGRMRQREGSGEGENNVIGRREGGRQITSSMRIGEMAMRGRGVGKWGRRIRTIRHAHATKDSWCDGYRRRFRYVRERSRVLLTRHRRRASTPSMRREQAARDQLACERRPKPARWIVRQQPTHELSRTTAIWRLRAPVPLPYPYH